MLLSRMYKLEKLVKLYKQNNRLNNFQQTSTICNSAKIHLYTIEDLKYIKSAMAIPYDDMLNHINYYYSHMMDEAEDLWFVSRLNKQYNLPCDLVVKRFHNVNNLSKHPYFGKKMKNIYSNDVSQKNNKELVKKLK